MWTQKRESPLYIVIDIYIYIYIQTSNFKFLTRGSMNNINNTDKVT